MRLLQKQRTYLYLLIILVVASSSTFTILLNQGNTLKGEFAKQELHNSLNMVNISTNQFYKPVNDALYIASDWAKLGLFEGDNAQSLNAKFTPLFNQIPQIRSMTITKKDGLEYRLSRSPLGWKSFYYDAANDSVANYQKWNKNLEMLDRADTLLPYRFFHTKSFQSFVEASPDSADWSNPHLIPDTDQISGISAMIQATSQGKQEEYIISFHVAIRDINDRIEATELPTHAKAFLFTSDLKLFNYEKQLDQEFDENDSSFSRFLIPFEKIIDTDIQKALATWKTKHVEDTPLVTSFRSEGKEWWAAYRPGQNEDYYLMLGLMIPEEDFSQIFTGRRGVVLIGTILILLASIVAIYLILSQRRSNDHVSPHFWEVDKIKTMIASGESRLLEFKSTVRMNLHKGQAGKEIEIAWLKSVVALMNTQGGTIMLGVNDEGEILGIEADRFPNKDKCLLHIQNLLKQHIGLEFTRYISVAIKNVDKKDIVILHMQTSPRPAFLKMGDKEQFFVRTGPSSVELPVSKALKYIEDRKS